ncbi:MAG: Toxin HigB-1 [Mycoplasmataceae bacterium]|nr:MAG: Toxin HigB-1 [Mycoplasmataceae bacterium]
MIKTFGNKDTEKIFRREVVNRWINIEKYALRKLLTLNSAKTLDDLTLIHGNRLHKLKGDREGKWSISINMQYRICFEWINGNAYEVEITKHYE